MNQTTTVIYPLSIYDYRRIHISNIFISFYILTLDNVRMQFKKHFSSNLKNLAIKKTYVVNQPSQPQYAKQDNSNSLLYQMNNYDHANRSNKQNVKYNNGNGYGFQISFKSNEKMQTEGDKFKKSPLLTFNKLKTLSIDKMQQCLSKKTSLPLNIEQGGHIRKISCHSKDNRNNLGQINYNEQANIQHNYYSQNSKSKGHIRYGSMLFGCSKNHENKAQTARGMRQSRSIDQMSLNQHKYEFSSIPCISNDGKYAKYKILNEDYGQQMLCYCFNCAIQLVKQGFSIQQLNNEDKHKLNLRHSTYNPQHQRSYSYHQEQRQSIQTKTAQMTNNIKFGQQLKCKIIMKLNKLKVGKQQFNKNVQNHLENIDYFYNSLIAHIEQQKVSDKNQVLRIKNLRKNEPENYENMLGSSLGSIDYMMRTLQNVNRQITEEIQQMLEHEVLYPRIKINIEPREGFQRRIDEFVQFFQKRLKICLIENEERMCISRSRRSTFSDEENRSSAKSNSLRFSFQEALQKSRKTKRTNQNESCINQLVMDPLQQQNQSQLQQSLQHSQKRQNAFRNLFPEDPDQSFQQRQLNGYNKSPVFKSF